MNLSETECAFLLSLVESRIIYLEEELEDLDRRGPSGNNHCLFNSCVQGLQDQISMLQTIEEKVAAGMYQ